MKYRGKNTGTVYTVIFSDERGMLIENVAAGRSWWTKREVEESLEEYREPRTLTKFVNVYQNPDGEVSIGNAMYPSKRSAGEVASHLIGKKLLETIEISWTEKV